MRSIAYVAAVAMGTIAASTAWGEEPCPRTWTRHKSVCVPHWMPAFFQCVDTTGTFLRLEVDANNKDVKKVTVEGEGGGKLPRFQLGIRGKFTEYTAHEAAEGVIAVLNPELQAACKSVIPKEPPPQPRQVKKAYRYMLSNFSEQPVAVIPRSHGALFCGLGQIEFGPKNMADVMKCSVWFDGEWKYYGSGSQVNCTYQCVWQ